MILMKLATIDWCGLPNEICVGSQYSRKTYNQGYSRTNKESYNQGYSRANYSPTIRAILEQTIVLHSGLF